MLMSTAKLKTDLHRQIDSIDDTAVLKAVHRLLSKLVHETVAGNETKGRAQNRRDLTKQTEKAETPMKKKHHFSIEDLDL
jgi:hypothetical protein